MHIHSWNSGERLVVSLDLLRDAFRESELMREYCALPEKNRLEPESITMYVLEALMAVIRQAHRSPGCQNIRANPSRADQVQVMVREGGERWEILTLVEAVRLLFRDAAGRIEHLAGTAAAQRALTPAELSASILMPQEYRRRPERYEREGKSRLAAHLATLAGGARRALSRDGPPRADRSPAAPPPEAPVGGEDRAAASDLSALDELLEDLAAAALEEPGGAAPLPDRAKAPIKPPGAAPPPFSPLAAAALLRKHPPQLDAKGRASPTSLRQLSELSGQDSSRIANHLWDAKEEGLLSPAEQGWADALIRLSDEAR